MKFFGNRAVALILAVIVVVGSTLLNTRLKLGEECQSVEDGFYTASSGSKSVYDRLDARLDAANGVWSLLESHGNSAAEELAVSRSVLLNAMDERDIGDMYDGNQALQTAFDKASAALLKLRLTKNEKDALEDYQTAFAGAQKMIDEADYNGAVLEFRRKVFDKFPASLLAPIVGLDGPELFD